MSANAKAEKAAETGTPNLLRRAKLEELCAWDHVNNPIRRHVPAAATAQEDLRVPEYWSEVASTMVQNDIIIAIPADASWFEQLLVREVLPQGVRMVHMFGARFDDLAMPPGAAKRTVDTEAVYQFGGPLMKWQVIARDGRILKSGLESEGAAMGWFAQHKHMQERTS